MRTLRFVFAPLFGTLECAQKLDGWAGQPHIKAWGYIDIDGDNEELVVLHAEPMVPAITIGETVRLLGDEYRALVDIDGSSELPEVVSVRLAQLALAPETLELGEAN